MGMLQTYQADLLGNLDEGGGIGLDAVNKLRWATDLSLHATKETARSIGRAMSALVATVRHLWLNLSAMKDKDKNFLMDAPLLPPDLFSNAVNTVVKRFQEASKQTAAFQKLLPTALRSQGLLSRSSPKLQKPAPPKNRAPPPERRGIGEALSTAAFKR